MAEWAILVGGFVIMVVDAVVVVVDAGTAVGFAAVATPNVVDLSSIVGMLLLVVVLEYLYTAVVAHDVGFGPKSGRFLHTRVEPLVA